MEDPRRRTTAPRAKKPSAKRAPTRPSGTRATVSHAGSCGPQRGARSRRVERDGDTTEKPHTPAPRVRPRRAAERTEDAQPLATDAAGASERPAVREPQRQVILDPEPPAVPEPQAPEDPEAPTVARGPVRRRGARSIRQPRASQGSRKEPDKLKKVLDKLRLKRKEISAAAETVNKVVDQLLRRMQRRESEFKGVEQLNTGSYYEHVKISAPNEFDVMFKLEVPRIELEEYYETGAFYRVKFKRIPRGNPLSHFLEGEVLSATKVLSKFRELIKEEVKEIKEKMDQLFLCFNVCEQIQMSPWRRKNQEALL
ncbi:cyclic GMP-AMP synthase isoform X2 [Rattus norvegicus]|nr:cyclic GMP-AMP synthase isoform X2 [Rattus norvegicus]